MNEKPKKPRRRGVLELIVFVGGTAVLVLELLASRILAPFLGTSIFVWASLIGIILGALSLGYYIGGYLSRQKPRLVLLGGVLFLAAVSIFAIILIKDFVLEFSASLGVQSGSVVATLLLFTLPTVLLGIISPYTIRLKIETIEASGKVAGNLYALSTIGSIFGAFLAGFYLIPTFSNTQILLGLSAVLFTVALIIAFDLAKFTVALIIMIGGSIATTTLRADTYIFEKDSAYNHIRVADLMEKSTDRPVRVLFLATESHSLIYRDSDDLYARYHQLYQLDNLFNPEISHALTLGGGAYVAPINFLQRYPAATMTVVEIDPAVTEVAKKYFRLSDDPRLTIAHQDARIFVNQTDQTYDVIYGDAFASFFSVPFHLTTREALNKINNLLANDGVLVLNIISSLEGEASLFFQSQYLTLTDVFPNLYIFPTRFYQPGDDLSRYQNIVIIATKDQHRLTKKELQQRATPEQQALLDHWWQNDIEINPGLKILTDEFAPVDFYISKLL